MFAASCIICHHCLKTLPHPVYNLRAKPGGMAKVFLHWVSQSSSIGLGSLQGVSWEQRYRKKETTVPCFKLREVTLSPGHLKAYFKIVLRTCFKHLYTLLQYLVFLSLSIELENNVSSTTGATCTSSPLFLTFSRALRNFILWPIDGMSCSVGLSVRDRRASPSMSLSDKKRLHVS